MKAMGLFDFLFKRKDTQSPTVPVVTDNLLDIIEVSSGITLPRAFAAKWPLLEKNKMTAIHIIATPKVELALEESKFGHYPCMPLNFDYPKDVEGRYMYPLAQINCKEMPSLHGYPDSGYLQFYISGFDDVYGIDFDNPQSQKNFRILYFEEAEVEKYKADFSFLDEVMASDMVPISAPHHLAFLIKEEYLGVGDIRYENTVGKELDAIAMDYPDIEDELQEFLYDNHTTNGHKLGGYAYFTQSDPRMDSEKFEDYILLFQLDSDDKIMWGDVGVANFFIHPDDLAKKDFSKVMYNWDCS